MEKTPEQMIEFKRDVDAAEGDVIDAAFERAECSDPERAEFYFAVGLKLISMANEILVELLPEGSAG